MKAYHTIFYIFLLTISCKTKTASLFYNLNDFSIADAKIFVSKVEIQPKILKVSILDANHNKNGFEVNEQTIFNDTIQPNYPNFYSYKKLANEININSDELNQLLLSFDKIRVSEFIREKDFFIFPVEKYALTKQKGYLYLIKNDAKTGDTLMTKTAYGDKIILKKQLEEKWFEYESLQ